MTILLFSLAMALNLAKEAAFKALSDLLAGILVVATEHTLA